MLEDIDLKIASEKTVTAVDYAYSTGYWCPTAYNCAPTHVCTTGCPW